MIKNSVLTGFDFGHVQPSTSLLVKTVDTQSKSGSQKQKKIAHLFKYTDKSVPNKTEIKIGIH